MRRALWVGAVCVDVLSHVVLVVHLSWLAASCGFFCIYIFNIIFFMRRL